MSAKHALLGLLIDKPGYPYELGHRLQQRLGPGWSMNPGQLYQTLDRLKRDDLIDTVDESIEKVSGNHTERVRRQVLAITTKGIDEFERWFDEIAGQPRSSRRPLHVKVTLAGPERLRRALEQVEAYERDRAEALAKLARVRDAIDIQERPVRADHLLRYLNVTAEIFELEGELRWAQQARGTVLWMLEEDVLWPSARQRADASRDRRGNSRAIRAELFGKMSREALQSVPDWQPR